MKGDLVMSSNLWDVYIWPISNAGLVKCVGKNLDFDKAVELCDGYLSGQFYDSYMVPAGTKLYI